ncbi:hypothetical protein ORI20_14050 [Mycobacterium sp. CVI_P3]|uniref:Uncharacterized protein n=1 Tax=Mycobacterium pinniadriaticum TaxID=2994102 RepID=A0ABT3SEL5_9MYCO|nr:hypothetical protein [Mycobacterium pinniadriaticum]MCX2931403.1 hypothetical protein [Mycobacterium pinniadriaticum]MCX2937827.1 hypothetical protein [Mycobacterium pinniadriaticum]
MTTPSPPDGGKFVTFAQVEARFEGGSFPADRASIVKWRILDVEDELMGLVPSLRELDPTADPESSDPVVAAAGVRVGKVQRLVIDKVLDLYRNPDGATSVNSGMDGFNEVRGYSQNRKRSGVGITFTDEELNRVRLPRRKRPPLGTLGARPWGVPC